MRAELILHKSRQCKQIGRCTEKEESVQRLPAYMFQFYIEDWWNEEAAENYKSDDVDKLGGFEK